MTFETAAAMPVSADQSGALVGMARSMSLPHRTVVQAKGLLLATDGAANQEIARRCEVDSDTVRRWRRRFADKGVEGVSPRCRQARSKRSRG